MSFIGRIRIEERCDVCVELWLKKDKRRKFRVDEVIWLMIEVD